MRKMIPFAQKKYITAIISILAVLGIYAVIYFVNGRKMTAKEYYYEMLPDKEFASYIPTDDETERISKHFGYSGKSMKEMREIAEQVTPEKVLNPLLSDIIRNTPSKYKAIADDVYTGVFPLGGFNARVLPSPNGGFLILVNYKLKKCLWEWAKLVVNVVFLQQTNPELLPDASIEDITKAFVKSTLNYVYFDSIPAFPEYAKDEKSIFVTLLQTSAMKFILAHEYSHILLGHVDSKPINISALSESHDPALHSSEYYAKEFDADMMGAEILLAQSSQDDFIELDPNMKSLGIYYCLAIFEILEFIDGRDSQVRTYPQMVKRLGEMKLFLSQKYDFSNHRIVNDFLQAIDYLVLQSVVAFSSMSRPQKTETPITHLETRTNRSPNREFTDLPNSENGLQRLLDKRNEQDESATNDPEFLAFMRDFCEMKRSEDWRSMVRLVSKTAKYNECFDILANHAVASSSKGVKDWDLPWSPDESLGSSGFIELALTILAAKQNTQDIKNVSLTTTQRSKILFVWRLLYGNTLVAIGSIDDPAPTKDDIQEAKDKNMASIEIAKLLQDPVLMSFSSLAGAWAFERIGYKKDEVSALRSSLNIDVEWPLISRKADDNYRIVYPKLDFLGNEIPESLDRVY